MLDFRILGSLEVRDDETPLGLGGAKDRAVLAILLLQAGRVVSRDSLIDAVWGEHPPATAAKSLRNSISQLRKLLGAEAVVTRAPGYTLPLAANQLDLDRFERLVGEARTAEPELRARKLGDALALWRGPALADFAYEAFAQTEIARLEELRLTALEQRIEAELEVGEPAELVSELESLVSEHPLRERFRAQLMLALYRSGRQAEALHAYQSARQALLESLGIDPGPALQQLHGSILRQESGLQQAPSLATVEDQCSEVVGALLAGRLVPVLGSDVVALAAHLATRFAYPDAATAELTRVSQYVDVMKGSGPLYDELHAVFVKEDVVPTSVHRFFASLPPLLRERGLPHQLLVTTSYDHALEQAFLDAGEEFDVVSYLASGRHRGKFCHIGPGGDARLVEVPNTYTELSLDRRTAILKLHGQVDRSPAREWESFVVTEDDYIEYLAQSELASVIPVSLAATLRRSHLLFLGYTMADWNLRVILNRLWGDSVSYRSWAVQPEAKPLERQFWRRRQVEVVEQPLETYAAALARYLGLEAQS
jgi:DNA-binding SARP family transcriptional activator